MNFSNLKMFAIGAGVGLIYLTPTYLLKKYFEHKYDNLLWRFNNLRDEVLKKN